jgi:hypothetical protein
MNLHEREDSVALVKAALQKDKGVQILSKGDVPGHEFHGNQYVGGGGASTDHPAYNTKVSLPGYYGKTTALSAVSPKDSAKAMRLAGATWTKDEHAQLAAAHTQAAADRKAAWGAEADKAAKETFGRPFQVTDYKISAIGSDKFSQRSKEALREHAYEESKHATLAAAHAYAAKHQRD